MSFTTGDDYYPITDPYIVSLYGSEMSILPIDESTYIPLSAELDLSGPQTLVVNATGSQLNIGNIGLTDQNGQIWSVTVSTTGEIETEAQLPLTPTPTPTSTSTPTLTPTVTPTPTDS
jgi:serine/threonine-protein kinase